MNVRPEEAGSGERMKTEQVEKDGGGQAAALSAVRLGFRDFLAAVEGLLVPDKPAVPGASRINMSLYPRSRLRANPALRAPKPRLPPKPGLPSPPKPGV